MIEPNTSKRISKKNQSRQYYACKECGVRYLEEKWAKRCENWCRKNHSYNLEMIKQAIKK